MNEILKNLVVIGVEGEARLEQMRELLDAQGDAYTFIDAHSPSGIALASDWAARPLPQAFYNGRLEFSTLPTCRRFLKKHGAQLPEEAPQNVLYNGFLEAPEQIRNAIQLGINPFELNAEAVRGQQPLRFVMDEMRDPDGDAAPFIENEEDEDDF